MKYFLILLMGLLCSCDQKASGTVVVMLDEGRASGQVVMNQINEKLSEAGFSKTGDWPGATYVGTLSEGERVTNIFISVTYDKEKKCVLVQSQQWVASKLTPKMLEVLSKMKAQLLSSGLVKDIRVR